MCRVLLGWNTMQKCMWVLSLIFIYLLWLRFIVTALEKKNIKEYKLIFPNVCHFSLQPSNKAKKQIFPVLFNCEKDSVKKSRISA